MRCWHWQKCTALSRKSLTYCCIHCSMQQMEVGILNAVGELWQLSKCLPETRLKLWNRHMRFVGHSICFSTSTVSDTAISVETSLSTSTPSAQAEMSWGYADCRTVVARTSSSSLNSTKSLISAITVRYRCFEWHKVLGGLVLANSECPWSYQVHCLIRYLRSSPSQADHAVSDELSWSVAQGTWDLCMVCSDSV